MIGCRFLEQIDPIGPIECRGPIECGLPVFPHRRGQWSIWLGGIPTLFRTTDVTITQTSTEMAENTCPLVPMKFVRRSRK